MDFFMRFTFISYASIFFFVVGLRLALFNHFKFNFSKFIFIFLVVIATLSIVFIQKPVLDRLFISLIWSSLIGIGYRFGMKLKV